METPNRAFADDRPLRHPEVYSTCPQSRDADQESYLRRVAEVARWSERIGCRGILVYTDNGLVDPWLVSQVIIQHTKQLRPLVAVQPAYMHPFAVAKMVATLGFLHRRGICLNMVAGGFKNDLAALDDRTPHDRRYARLVEYTRIITGVLREPGGMNLHGDFYRVNNLKMTPRLPDDLQPEIMVSGSSDAGRDAARALCATAISYPRPPGEDSGPAAGTGLRCGIRIGIVARDDGADAWRIARARFPEDHRGQLVHQLAMKVSDSTWHRQLATADAQPPGLDNPYWLGPFHNHKTFCPYLVGSYERVAREVASYMALGYRTIILDIPPSREELEHTGEVFRRALEMAPSW